MFLLFQLRRLDVWPTGDLGVRRGYGLAWANPHTKRRGTSNTRRPLPAVPICRRLVLLARRAGATDSALTECLERWPHQCGSGQEKSHVRAVL